jgi:hypothetical protein
VRAAQRKVEVKRLLRALIILGGVIAVTVALYLSMLVAIAFFGHGFTLAEMDWNRDGRTTLPEMLEGADVGERQSIDDPRCRELFSTRMECPRKSCARQAAMEFQTDALSPQNPACAMRTNRVRIFQRGIDGDFV